MNLTSTQATTLKNDIAANTTVITNPTTGQATQIKNIPIDDGGGANAIAAWYNLPCATDFFGNYATVPVEDIFNALLWKNYTPTDAVPTLDVLSATIYQARAAFAAAYQINIQTMLIGRLILNATKENIVSGLKDATNTNMPTGASGASQKGGWATVQTIICRKATNLEKLFADLAGGNGGSNTTAATFVLEGSITGENVFAARNS